MKSILTWLVLAALLAGLAFILVRRPGAMFMSALRRSRPLSRSVRLVCGSLGFAILAAVTAGTWLAIPLDYTLQPTAAEVRFHIPTKRVAPPANLVFADVPQSRLLIHLVVAEASPAGLNPLHVEEIDTQWSPNQQPFTRHFSAGDHQFEYSFVISAVYYSRTRTAGTVPVLKIVGKESYSVKDSDGKSVAHAGSAQSWLSFGRRDIIDVLRVRQDGRPPQTVLSILPRSSRGNIHLLFFVTRLHDDDPLTATSWAGFCQQWGADGAETIRAEVVEPWSGADSGTPERGALLRGTAFLNRMGIAGLLLLAAAIPLTQLFVHRVLAFPGVLAVVVLFSAVLDRAVLGVHQSRLDDPGSSRTMRMVACDRLAYSFFFRKSATKRLEALARDGQAPDKMRYLANDAALWLGASLPRIVIPGAFASFMNLAQVPPAPMNPMTVDDVLASPFEVWPAPGVVSFAFSPDSRSLALCRIGVGGNSDHAVEVWDLQTRRLRYSIPDLRSLESMAFSPDSRILATAVTEFVPGPGAQQTPKSVVRLWDLQANPPRLLSSLPLGQVNNSVAFSPNGKMLLCSGDRRAELWDITDIPPKTRAPRWSRAFYDETDLGWTPPPVPVFSPDSKTLALVGKVHWVPSSSQPDSVLVSTGGGAVELWDIPAKVTAKPRLRRTLPTLMIRALAFSPDGKRLACMRRVYVSTSAPSVGDYIQMFDAKTGAFLWRRLTDSEANAQPPSMQLEMPFGLPFSPDGKLLAIIELIQDAQGAYIANRIELWDAQNGRTRRSIEQLPTQLTYVNRTSVPTVKPVDVITGCEFSPDGKTLALLQANQLRLLKISDFSTLPD